MSQTERVFYILNKLGQQRFFTVGETADRFEVSVRSIKRDIEYIRERLGVQITYETGISAHYTITEDDQDLLNVIRKGEGLLFLSLLKSLSHNHFLFPVDYKPIRDSLKIPDKGSEIDVTERISYSMSEGKELNFNLFHDLVFSIQKQRQLEISYQDLQGACSKRFIEPQYLRNSDGQWYLLAWCHFREEMRVFHVSRINSWLSTEKPYKISISREKVLKFLDSSFGIMSGAGATKDVSILFTGKSIRLNQGKKWHPDQRVENTDSGVIVTFPVHTYDEILREVLSYNSEAEVLEPHEFRELWLETIREMAEKFL